MNKKFLITGGAGFIGSAVIRHIIDNTSHSVVNVDNLTYAGNLDSLASVENESRYEFEKVDICNSLDIGHVLSKHKPDVIMHLAAESHVDRSIDGPSKFIETNIFGTYVLLEQSKEYWLSLDDKKKIILNFIMFLLMKFMVTWVKKTLYSLRKRLMHQAHHIRHPRQAPII